MTGYLYQFLGIASLRARAITVSDLDSELACDLVTSIQDGELVHELHGQDAVIKVQHASKGENVGIQYKHAKTASRMTIERSELIDILHVFDRSQREAQNRGESLDRFVLVTNRSLDENSQALFQKKTSAQVPPELVIREATQAGRKIAGAKKVVEEYGSAAAAAAAWHGVLGKLSIWRDLRYEAAVLELKKLATQHGLTPDEFDAARGRIISSIIEATVVGPLTITMEWLTECLVNAPDARVLRLNSPDPTTRSVAAATVRRKMTESVVRNDSSLIRRRLIDEVWSMVRQFPVVWIIGDGGCGKSVLGLQVLIQESSARLTMFLRGRTATHANCLTDALRSIRSENHSYLLPQEPVAKLLDRVRIANNGLQVPLLLIDIDGLDEVPEGERHGLRQLIDQLFTRARSGTADAVLILTCRSPSRTKTRALERLILEWFDTDLPDVIAGQIGAIHVGDFDDDELREAARVLAHDVYSRIEEMNLWREGADEATLGANPFYVDGASPREMEIIGSLRHPAMWGVFADLPFADRLSALSGSRASLETMAEGFLNRFVRKTVTRFTTLREHNIQASLAAIAVTPAHNEAVRERQGDWVQPAIGPLNSNEAVVLYAEALSYGLIREDAPGRWRWRHGFVCDHLRGGHE
ncbi:MAG: hypothetical protein IT428_15760 [Planctomycetaceae bacterium]|nr:hypothetical protein [Planctomycetaceae bacterium]